MSTPSLVKHNKQQVLGDLRENLFSASAPHQAELGSNGPDSTLVKEYTIYLAMFQ